MILFQDNKHIDPFAVYMRNPEHEYSTLRGIVNTAIYKKDFNPLAECLKVSIIIMHVDTVIILCSYLYRC